MSDPQAARVSASAGAHIVRTVVDLRAALAPARREGRRIGLVPTMGALHEGHTSLIERARAACDVVVVSVFVNPTQFDEASDLERYPRDEAHDAETAASAGADVVFAPPVEEVYPDGFATTVEVTGLSETLEGAARGAGHFRGVATVVAKLLCMTLPDAAYFGQKDAQQVLVIRRLAADLDIPVAIETGPTVREPDGLALSSRNARLSAEERERALALPAALAIAQHLARDGERSASVLLGAAREEMRSRGVEPEYLALVDPDTLDAREELDADLLLLVAARIGATRLIDNVILSPALEYVAAQPARRKVAA
ncbi:MAG TPA: pantoate--beta-alanine ligase [Solirubrobacteraceae bacterium]|nr:pantoate--beta-alanine ligase [Solirubrobacteraceae bacterium]